MSEQRWTIYVCKDCGRLAHSGDRCSKDRRRVWTEIEPVEVVPESELSLSLAREQRLRDLLTIFVECAEATSLDADMIISPTPETISKAREALSSVPDGEQR